MLGIAHEVAAITGTEVDEPDLDYPEDDEPIGGQVTVEIANPELCSRYAASLVTGVAVGRVPLCESLAVIRGEHDQRVLEPSPLFQPVEQ